MTNLSGYINNQLVETSHVIDVLSPENGEIVAKVDAMSQEQINFAIKSSNKVFSLWKNVSWGVKKFIFNRFCEQLVTHQDELAKLMVQCIAKPHKECLKEINRSVAYINATIDIYEKCFVNPTKIDEPKAMLMHKTGFFKREPLGVVLAISPFNYPVNLSLAKIVPALLSGNVVVFKPATQAAPVGIHLVKLLIKSGIPAGVIQCVVGTGKDLGSSLIQNPKIAAINFTGSSSVGRKIMQEAQADRIILEMGGLDAALVFSDADLGLAAKEIVKGAFNYSGQRCTAVKRVIVDELVAEPLTEKIIQLTQKLTSGKAMDNVDITALISENVVNNAIKAVKQATDLGAKLLTKFTRKKNFLSPLVLYNVRPDMDVAKTELFAPVLPIIQAKNFEEMVKINNATDFGLQASVFTSDYQKVLQLFNELDVGTLNWNRAPSRSPDHFPFLGVKDSGVGEQGLKEAIISMTRTKGLTVVNDDLSDQFLKQLNAKPEV